jgi:hypothetical protein
LIGALGANEVLAITLGGIAPAIVFCSKFLGGGGRAMVRVAVTGDEFPSFCRWTQQVILDINSAIHSQVAPSESLH